jgi:hypothetical protein
MFKDKKEIRHHVKNYNLIVNWIIIMDDMRLS